MYIETVMQPEAANIICNSEVTVVTYIANDMCTGIIKSQSDKSELLRIDINGGTTDEMNLAMTSILKTVHSHVNSGSWDGGPIDIRLDTETSVADALRQNGVVIIKDDM
ncbi:MAG: hypothetical protein ACNFW9_02440 [Candidatus Kerfeldbacteria bacterium]|jgi:hypothetical protein